MSSARDFAKAKRNFQMFANSMEEVAQNSVNAGAEFIADVVRQNARATFTPRSGKLFASVRVHPEKLPATINRDYVRSRELKKDELGAIISVGDPDRAPVARFLEEGTSKMPEAKPFVRPALDTGGKPSIAMAAQRSMDETSRVAHSLRVRENGD